MDLFSNVSGRRRLKSTARLHDSARRNSVVSGPPKPTTTTNNTKEEVQELSVSASDPTHLPPRGSVLARRAAPVLARSYNSMPAIPQWELQEPLELDPSSAASLSSSALNEYHPFDASAPPANQEIDQLFEEVANRLDLSLADGDVKELPIEKKEWILHNESELTRQLGHLMHTRSRQRLNRARSMRSMNNALKPSSKKQRGDQNTQQQQSLAKSYIKPFLKADRKTDKLKMAADLTARLENMSLGGIKQLIDDGGMQLIHLELEKLHKKADRKQKDCLIELELIKCLKIMINNVYGIQEVLGDSQYIDGITRSLLSPYVPTRRIACDALTFLCYCDIPNGHSMVLHGMEVLKKAKNATGRFDTWLDAFEKILDARGKMGSLVGASKDYLKHIGISGNIEENLIEYGLANVLLINAMVDPEVVEDLDARVALRNQLYQAGLTRIFDKMIPLQNDLLHRKMDEFQEVEENDAALIYGDMMLNETMDPPEILSNILRMITGTEAYDCLRSILQHIMLIQGDTQAGVECYRLLESIVSEIVLRYNDRHAEDYYTGTLTVDALIAKFAEENELKQALEDAAPRSNFLRVEGGNNEASGQENASEQVSQLQLRVESLERTLRVADQTNNMLKQQLNDLELEYQQTVQVMDAQNKRLYDTVRQLTEYGSPAEKRRVHRSSRKFQTDPEIRLWEQQVGRRKASIDAGQIDDQRDENAGTEEPRQPAKTKLGSRMAAFVKRTSQQDTLLRKIVDHISDSSSKSDGFSSAPATPVDAISLRSRKSNRTSSIFSVSLESLRSTGSTEDLTKVDGDNTPVLDTAAPVTEESTPQNDNLEENSASEQIQDTAEKEAGGAQEEPDTQNEVPPAAPPPPPPPPPPAPVLIEPEGEVPAPPPPPPPGPSTSGSFPEGHRSPPPPPLMLGNIGRKSSAFQSKRKLKFVEWEKMNSTNIKQTIWSQLEKTMEAHQDGSAPFEQSIEYQLARAGIFDDIEKMFEQRPAMELKVKQSKTQVHALESRKAYNLNIFLTSIMRKIPFEEIVPRLLGMDPYFDDEQVLNNLVKFAPTPEETGKLAPYATLTPSDREYQDLSLPDKFCLQVMNIKRFKERLQCMHFRTVFYERYHQLHKQMTSIFDASLSLKNAKHFGQLLHLILLLGNFLNGNTYRGGAFGIRIASINKLVDTKGTNNPTTFLHFLVDTAEKYFPDMLHFLEELEECGEACKVHRTEMNNEFRELETGLANIDQELKEHYDENTHSEDDRFLPVMRDFHTQASTEFKRLYLLRNKMGEWYDKVVRYYGEDPTKMHPDEFFGIFKKFTSSWERCTADVKLARQRVERLEKQKKREQERRTRARSGSSVRGKGVDLSSCNNSSENAIMDGLMKKLRMVTTGASKASRRRNEQRLHRQRSASICSNNTPHIDSVSLRAHRMLQSIQSEDSTSLLTASPIQLDWNGGTELAQQLDNAFPAPPPTPSSTSFDPRRRRRTSADYHHSATLTTPRSAIQTPFFQTHLLSSSRSTSTRMPRQRKLSRKPPPFDRSSLPPRVRARRFSTK